MEHGNLAKWMKKEGDTVSAGEVIAEIETDKATMEVEAVDEGVLAKIIVAEGAQEVPINSLIAVLLEEGEDAASLDAFVVAESASPAAAPVAKKPETKIEKQAAPAPVIAPEPTKQSVAPVKNSGARILASPLAKRVATMEGVSLSSLTGTGPHGRIIKADVLAGGKMKSVVFAGKASKAKGAVARHSEEYKTIPNNNMRKIIAKRLLESKQTVPHFYLSMECMMDSVLEVRAQLNASSGDDKSKKLSVNDFVIMATAKALQDVPEANASWSEEAIMMYNNVDVSVAVAIEGGLITPVIRNANQKEITAISAEMKDLAGRARENALKPEEFQGGGFSISNLGMYGVKNFNAIINPPQGCILAVGMSSKRAVIINDKIEIRTVMDVNLSCDHRVVDGAIGATFLASFKKYMESPILMFI